MKTRLLICVFLATAFAIPSFAAPDDAPDASLKARSFEIRHKTLERAAGLIAPLLSETGSVSLQPSKSALVVTDRAENLQKISEMLSRYDSPPRHFTVQLTLVNASRERVARSEVPEDLKVVADKLTGVLRFNSFEKVASINAEGNEGDPVVLSMDGSYHATFRIGEYDPVTNTVRVEGFRLDRLSNSQGEGETLLKTSLNLRLGQVVVLGASRGPQSAKALMLVLVAEEAE